MHIVFSDAVYLLLFLQKSESVVVDTHLLEDVLLSVVCKIHVYQIAWRMSHGYVAKTLLVGTATELGLFTSQLCKQHVYARNIGYACAFDNAAAR